MCILRGLKGGEVMNIFLAILATIQFLLVVSNKQLEARKMYCIMYIVTICGVIINTVVPTILK